MTITYKILNNQGLVRNLSVLINNHLIKIILISLFLNDCAHNTGDNNEKN